MNKYPSPAPLLLSAAGVFALTSCSLAGQLSGGKLGSDNANGDSVLGGAPPAAALVAGEAPPWCDNYEPNQDDPAIKWYKPERGWDEQNLNYAAMASCDNVSKARSAKIKEWQASWMEAYGGSAADFAASMRFHLNKDTLYKTQESSCEAIGKPDAEASQTEKVSHYAMETVFSCKTLPNQGITFWIDTPNLSEIDRLSFIDGCLHSSDAIMNYAHCGYDLENLNREKFDKEIAAKNLTEPQRALAVESFLKLKNKGDALLAKLDEEVKKNDAYEEIVSAYKAGVDDWFKTYKSNKKLFDRIWEIQNIASEMNMKKAVGCSDELLKEFRSQIRTKAKGKTFENIREAHGALLDEITVPLASALAICLSMEKRTFESRQVMDFLNQAGTYKGPRYAAYYAFLVAYRNVVKDRPKFTFGGSKTFAVLGSNPLLKEYAARNAKVGPTGISEGQIEKISGTGDTKTISFKKVSYKGTENYDCKTTNKISRIDDYGNVIYHEKCKTKKVTRVYETKPIKALTSYTKGLKKGQMVTFNLEQEVGVPVEVFQSSKKEKLIGFLGVVWK